MFLVAYQKSTLLSRQHTKIIVRFSYFYLILFFLFRYCCALLTSPWCIRGPCLPTDGTWLRKAKSELFIQAFHHLPLWGCRPTGSGCCGVSQDAQREAGRRLHHPVTVLLFEDVLSRHQCTLILCVLTKEHFSEFTFLSAINLSTVIWSILTLFLCCS